jgi:hypothetical protein
MIETDPISVTLYSLVIWNSGLPREPRTPLILSVIKIIKIIYDLGLSLPFLATVQDLVWRDVTADLGDVTKEKLIHRSKDLFEYFLLLNHGNLE